MTRLLLAVIIAAVITGCGPGEPEGPTYEQATAIYKDELAILDKLQNDRTRLVDEYEAGEKDRTEKMNAILDSVGYGDGKERIEAIRAEDIALRQPHRDELKALDAKVATQQASVDKAEAARDALR